MAFRFCIAFTGDGDDDEWRFVGPAGAIVAPVSGRVRLNNRHAIRQAALGGLGVALLQEYLVVHVAARSDRLSGAPSV